MDLYLDITGRQFVTSKSTITPLTRIPLGQGDRIPIRIFFLGRTGQEGTPLEVVELPEPFTSIAFTGRPQADLEDDELLFSCTDFTG